MFTKFILFLAITNFTSSMPILLGGCLGTEYGCCPDGETSCQTQDCKSCFIEIGGCLGTAYGCCPDGETSCQTQDCKACLLMEE